jgi:hypothetical protein
MLIDSSASASAQSYKRIMSRLSVEGKFNSIFGPGHHTYFHEFAA